MSNSLFAERVRRSARSAFTWVQAAILAGAAMMPFMAAQVSAAQLTARSVTIDKSKVSATNVQHIFGYTIQTSAAVQGITYEFCTTPLGTCTLPTGMSVQAASHTSQTGFPNNGTAFTAHAVSDENSCSMGTNAYMMCFERSEATTGTGAATHTIAGITAPSSKQTVYVRVTLYSNDTFTTATDSGTVAEAFVDQLITNGRVQERLDFCVAAIDGAAALPASVSACSALNTHTIDIGVIDNSSVAVSPVTTTATNGSNNNYGILMVNTNASSGVGVSYFPEAAATGTNQLRNFRVTGATCNASDANATDQCFQPTATTGTTVSAGGGEYFGLQIPCIDNTQGTTNSFDTTNGATINGSYNNTDADTDSATDCQLTSAGGSHDQGTKFAWDNTGSAVSLAATTTVVDDEIIKVRFGASAASTTPTGAYTVTTNYIATPTF